MTVTIDGFVFERSNYDTDGDVMYLTRGDQSRLLALRSDTVPFVMNGSRSDRKGG